MSYEDLSPKDAAKAFIIDACVQSAKSRGCGDAIGVLRGTLFLAIEPMSMDDLASVTGYSKSTISFNMNLLENLGLARRIITPGDKKYRYVNVYDPDVMRNAMMAQVKKEVALIMGALDSAERVLAGDGNGHVIEQIRDIRDFYTKVEQLLRLMSRYTTDELIDILEAGPKDAGV